MMDVYMLLLFESLRNTSLGKIFDQTANMKIEETVGGV